MSTCLFPNSIRKPRNRWLKITWIVNFSKITSKRPKVKETFISHESRFSGRWPEKIWTFPKAFVVYTFSKKKKDPERSLLKEIRQSDDQQFITASLVSPVDAGANPAQECAGWAVSCEPHIIHQPVNHSIFHTARDEMKNKKKHQKIAKKKEKNKE